MHVNKYAYKSKALDTWQNFLEMVLCYICVKKLHSLFMGYFFPMINQLLMIKMGIPLLAHK